MYKKYSMGGPEFRNTRCICWLHCIGIASHATYNCPLLLHIPGDRQLVCCRLLVEQINKQLLKLLKIFQGCSVYLLGLAL